MTIIKHSDLLDAYNNGSLEDILWYEEDKSILLDNVICLIKRIQMLERKSPPDKNLERIQLLERQLGPSLIKNPISELGELREKNKELIAQLSELREKNKELIAQNKELMAQLPKEGILFYTFFDEET